jgi:LAO/AO transport system kinase
MLPIQQTISKIQSGNYKTLARCITMIENEEYGFEEILGNLQIDSRIPIIGITGPPGAGKSTLLNGIIKKLLSDPSKKIGIIVIDPSSPFHRGAILGDRIRMSEHFTHPSVFIRSLATRGALGGLSAKAIEISDIMRSAGFDYIFIETVGVGQSEIEIAGLADLTVLVLVPEAGDEVQTLKAGIMEVADIFVVNKSDRDDANTMVKNLTEMLDEKENRTIVKTIATTLEGIDNLIIEIETHLKSFSLEKKSKKLLLQKAFQLILNQKAKTINKLRLEDDINKASEKNNFNLYAFVKNWILKNKQV